MGCSCDYDLPDFYDKRLVKARLPHYCSECGCVIAPGEQYERVSGKWDGEVYTFKTCRQCRQIRNEFSTMKCFCWAHGGLWEAVQEQLAEADYTPGGKFSFYRLIASHRKGLRRLV